MISALKTAVHRFFFAEETPYGMALVRIFLPIAAGIPMWLRFARVRELYSIDGAPVQLFEIFSSATRLPVFAPAIAVPLFALMLLCFVTTSLGFRTRLSLAIGTCLYIYFCMLDSVATMTKYNVIASHLLLLLTVSPCGAVWSIDAVLRERQAKIKHLPPPQFPIWSARLAQILFAAIYFGAAITKIQTTAFFSGEQMRYWMLSNWNYSNPIGEVMAMWSPLLLVSAYIAVVWEMVFPFLAWRPIGRYFALGMGVFFHLMTNVTLGLWIFPAVCLSGYFAFVSEQDVTAFRKWARRLKIKHWSRFGAGWIGVLNRCPRWVPAPVVWVLLACVSAVFATEVELRMDLYGRASGGYQLKPVEKSVAESMIRSNSAVREQDKFFSFDIGTHTVGGQLANRRHKFEFGETMIAQANLNPPHEDLWLECQLQDTEGRTIEQFGQLATRDMLRTNFTYHFGNRLQPGDYSVVLKSSNREIFRRSFRLIGQPDTATLLTN